MAINLSTLNFTNEADIVPLSGTAEIFNDGIANTLAGNDSITGTGSRTSDTSTENFGIIIRNTSILNTGAGEDSITGIGGMTTAPFGPFGIYINGGTIDTDTGNDSIIGIGGTAIFFNGSINIGLGIFIGSGSINTGAGDDSIIGYGGITAYGSKIDTGTGDDSIIGNGGINNNLDATIKTDSGDDQIIGNSQDPITGADNYFAIANYFIIDTGSGNDEITGTTTRDYGIINGGNLDTGAGNDQITGTGSYFGILNDGSINTDSGDDTINVTSSYIGIENRGIINTAAGKDIVDALTGGFGGNGTLLLGDGDDLLKGFGSGYFDGGNGKDALLLAQGSYAISSTINADGFYTISLGFTDMFVKNFELIGSASNPAAVFNFSSVVGQTLIV